MKAVSHSHTRTGGMIFDPAPARPMTGSSRSRVITQRGLPAPVPLGVEKLATIHTDCVRLLDGTKKQASKTKAGSVTIRGKSVNCTVLLQI